MKVKKAPSEWRGSCGRPCSPLSPPRSNVCVCTHRGFYGAQGLMSASAGSIGAVCSARARTRQRTAPRPTNIAKQMQARRCAHLPVAVDGRPWWLLRGVHVSPLPPPSRRRRLCGGGQRAECVARGAVRGGRRRAPGRGVLHAAVPCAAWSPHTHAAQGWRGSGQARGRHGRRRVGRRCVMTFVMYDDRFY